MKLKTENFQESCKKILEAVDSNGISLISETLELSKKGDKVHLNVTNKEYYVTAINDVDDTDEVFHVVVEAKLFLTLISKITTQELELIAKENTLIVKGNGTYRLPLIYDDDTLVALPEITIENITSEFEIPRDTLTSILAYNTKELTKGQIFKPVQKLYYIDNNGAITFTSGACVNNFTLEKPVKILLTQKLVRLFKLFKSESVHFTLGYDALPNGIIQAKVRFESDNVVITSILPSDESLLSSVPVANIRNMANATYKYSVNINKDSLIQTINRLLIFSSLNRFESVKPFSKFKFAKDGVTISSIKDESNEIIPYTNNEVNINDDYEMILDLVDLKSVLENCVEQYLTFNFGDNRAVVVARGTIKNVIPEIHLE